MKIICHRANLNGKDEKRENKLWAIKDCLSKNYDVEIDIHCINNKLFLGHDQPDEKIDIFFLKKHKKKLWIHTKNIEAVLFFSNNNLDLNWFWHENDKITLTSRKIPWCYPDTYIETGVSVVLEYKKIPKIFGVCTDNALKWRI
jgi:hypothetical protein